MKANQTITFQIDSDDESLINDANSVLYDIMTEFHKVGAQSCTIEILQNAMDILTAVLNGESFEV